MYVVYIYKHNTLLPSLYITLYFTIVVTIRSTTITEMHKRLPTTRRINRICNTRLQVPHHSTPSHSFLPPLPGSKHPLTACHGDTPSLRFL